MENSYGGSANTKAMQATSGSQYDPACLQVLADVFLMENVIHGLLHCLQHVVQPAGSLNVAVITARLQQVACVVPLPANASEVHQHVHNYWKAMCGELDKTRN